MEEFERKKTRQLTLWVDDRTYSELESYVSKYDGTTKSSVLRQSIYEFFHREEMWENIKNEIGQLLGEK